MLVFAAFLRFNGFVKLVLSDVELDSAKLQSFIESRKTDKYRDGAWIVLAVSGKATCPVNMLNRYLDKGAPVFFFASYPRLNMAINLELEVLAKLVQNKFKLRSLEALSSFTSYQNAKS